MPSYLYSLSSIDRPSPRFVLVFLLLHGLLFLGVEYILFQYFPIFTLIHAVMGIVIYLIFWRGWFPKLFRDVFIGALIAIISGMMFGDAILDNFFVLYDEAPRGLVSSIYSSLVVFYIYFYVTLVKRTMSRTIS